jgi:hypothetical protein
MEPEQNSQPTQIPLQSFTPLYCIVTDADEIPLTGQSKIVRYSGERLAFLGEDDRFLRHLSLYPPQCLLLNEHSLPVDTINSLFDEFSKFAEEYGFAEEEIVRGSVGKVTSLHGYLNLLITEVRALQLYKKGRLVVGDSLIYLPSLDIRLVTRCTDMNLDYQALEHYGAHYEFNSEEMRNFLIFFISFLEFTTTIANKVPEIDLAIHRYCKETAHYGDVIDLMISLESLLVPETEGIAFKLAQRVANLLGTDATSRKEVFKEIQEFYGLRSKTVHGVIKLKPKEAAAKQQLDELREITRKVILSVIPLAAESGMGQEFPVLLNDMCLDDDLRRATQEKASVLLKTHASND